MKTPCLLILLLFCGSLTAQSSAEIDQQVWRLFIQSFNSGDYEKFSSVHSKDVIRVTQDNKQISGYAEYFKKQPDSIKAKRAVWKRNLELRFLQRIDGADKAFETGYYKTSSTNTVTGEKRISYGKFHVLLRKENGTWKILMDADAHENVNETIFLSAEPIKE
jgi:ketosteroid isomerase-like protein